MGPARVLVPAAGRVCGLVLSQWAGKTTLLGIAANVLQPTTGTLRVSGEVHNPRRPIGAPRAGPDHRCTAFIFVSGRKRLVRRDVVGGTGTGRDHPDCVSREHRPVPRPARPSGRLAPVCVGDAMAGQTGSSLSAKCYCTGGQGTLLRQF